MQGPAVQRPTRIAAVDDSNVNELIDSKSLLLHSDLAERKALTVYLVNFHSLGYGNSNFVEIEGDIVDSAPLL